MRALVPQLLNGRQPLDLVKLWRIGQFHFHMQLELPQIPHHD